ncbi:MAG: RNA polymerase sigma factor [Thermoguttaceae bacterium]
MSKSVGPIGANGDGHGEFWDEWRKIEGKVRADCEKRAQCVQDAEEIFSQTRLAACKNFAKFSGRSTFYTWAIGIARHNVAHLLKARIKRRKREQPLGDIVDSLVERHQSRRPFAADVVARLITLVPRAADASHLTASEASVLVARLGQPNAGWVDIARSFHRAETWCWKTFERAVSKLCVYLVVHCPDSLGGLPQIRAALDAAKADRECPMTPNEVRAFENLVLNGQLDHHQRRWQTALRSACAKVCRQFDWITLPPPPPRNYKLGSRRTISANFQETCRSPVRNCTPRGLI